MSRSMSARASTHAGGELKSRRSTVARTLMLSVLLAAAAAVLFSGAREAHAQTAPPSDSDSRPRVMAGSSTPRRTA
jgi:hypothetical protein